MNINSMTVQEACDYAVMRIVEQGERCMSSENCAYSDDKGNHCAIGWLLPEDDEVLMRSKKGLLDLIEFNRNRIPQIILDNDDAFYSLQKFHDCKRKSSRACWSLELKDLGIDVSALHWKRWMDMGED